MSTTRPPFFLILLGLGACGGESPPPGDADGDADADADADADGDADGDGDADLAARLAGAWDLHGVTCGGTDLDQPYDGARVALQIDGAEGVLSITRAACAIFLPVEIAIDESEARLTATPQGPIGCVREGCSESCGQDAGIYPTLTGIVDVADGDERFTLTADDPETLGGLVCTQPGRPLPSAQEFRRRSDEPIEIDDSSCHVDPFADGRTVYYVAANEPGADNDACDGLAPRDEGGGRCPFRDFSSGRVRALLSVDEDGFGYTHGVTVAVRAGTYVIEPRPVMPDVPDGGLWIASDATRPEDAVVLTAYENEEAILDGTCPSDVPTCDSPEDPGRIWQLLNLLGRYVVVQGMTFDNVHKWNITVMAGDACIQDNELRGSYGSDSDSIKSFEGSGPNVIVRRNDVHDGYEQAIDATNAYGWLIEDNDFHGGNDRGVGFKLGATDCIVRGNRFYDLPGEAVSLGGTSSDHVYAHEAAKLVMEDNVVTNAGGLADLYSCHACVIRNNVLDGGLVAVRVHDSDPSGCPGGCPPTTDLEIRGNRFRDLHGDPPEVEDATPPNAFVAFDSGAPGLDAGDNLYCALAGSPELFAVDGAIVGFAEWRSLTGTDDTSTLAAADSPECSGAW